MSLSDDELAELARIDAELARVDSRLNRRMQPSRSVDRRLRRASLIGSAMVLGLVVIGALTGLPLAYMLAWFVFLLAGAAACAAYRN